VYWRRLVEVFGINPPLRLDIAASAFKVADAPLYCVSIVTPAVLFQESGLFIVQVSA
jgi:hypothetical protein